MTTYNDVLLVDQDLNRITCIPIDYYIKDDYIIWSGYIFNDTDYVVANCKITTSSPFEGVFSISGGDLTEYTLVTSDLNTTCNVGTIAANSTEAINLQIFISGGSSLTGLQMASLYISK